MNIDNLPLQPDDVIGIAELSIACAISRVELEELMEYGALLPITTLSKEPVFLLEWLPPLRIAGKLRRDFDLDLFVVVIAMDYLRKIEALEARVQSLEAQTGASQQRN